MYAPEHRRWNFTAALIDAAGWGLGLGVISHDTFLPLFVSDLNGSNYAVGWIKTLLAFGWYVPGILVAGWIERLVQVKRFVMTIAVLERSFLLAMVPLCLWLGPEHRTALLWAFFLCWGAMTFAMGCNSPSYMKLIAKTVPPEWRGRLYGIGGAVAGLLGVLGAELAVWLLRDLGYPNGYAACFGIAFLIQMVTVLPLGFMREPVSVSVPAEFRRENAKEANTRNRINTKTRRHEDTKPAGAGGGSRSESAPGSPVAPLLSSVRTFVSSCLRVFVSRPGSRFRSRRAFAAKRSDRSSPARDYARLLRDDPVLQGFVLVGILFAANLMATAFYTKYAIDRFHAGVVVVGRFTMVLMASQVVANLVCGSVGDRAGNKRLLELGLIAGIAAPLLAWAAPTVGWLYPAFALNQIAVASWGIAQINYVLELCGPERSATYSAVAGLLIGPFRAATPLLGAWLVGVIGYRPLFGLTAALTLGALAVSIRWVSEPRGKTGVRGGTDACSWRWSWSGVSEGVPAGRFDRGEAPPPLTPDPSPLTPGA